MHVPVLPHPFIFLSGQVTQRCTEVELHMYMHTVKIVPYIKPKCNQTGHFC